jgi:hypothetical protein
VPNLDILDIGGLAVTTADLGKHLNYRCLYNSRGSVFRCTAEVVYPGCKFGLMQPGEFPDDDDPDDDGMKSLREIHIDPLGLIADEHTPITAFCKEYSQLEEEIWFDNASRYNDGADWVLLREYPNLERVTLKHADYRERYNGNPTDCFWKTLPQEVLIKFVRHTPKLRWFCSDLTQENIAILKEERPEVEFCN